MLAAGRWPVASLKENTMSNNQKNALIRLAIARFGNLVKWGAHFTFGEFAKLIAHFASDADSQAIAQVVSQAEGQIWRDRSGIRVTWSGV